MRKPAKTFEDSLVEQKAHRWGLAVCPESSAQRAFCFVPLSGSASYVTRSLLILNSDSWVLTAD